MQQHSKATATLMVLERSVRARSQPHTDRDEELLIRMMALAGFVTYDPDHPIRLHSGMDKRR